MADLEPTDIDRDALDMRIEDIVEEIRAYREQVEQLEICITELKAELGHLLEQRGENWSDDKGYARLVSEGERISYNTSALDQLLISDPLRYGWLKDYRVKSPVRGAVQVK